MAENKLKERWKAGKAAVNGWLAIPSGFSAEVMAQCGWDSVTVDMQHGVQDYQTMVPVLPGDGPATRDEVGTGTLERARDHRQGAGRRLRRHLPDGEYTRRGTGAGFLLPLSPKGA